MAAPRGAPPTPSRIEALSRLDDIEMLVDQFAAKAGYEPELLSHWDPKPEALVEIEGWLATGTARFSPVPYAYSCYLNVEDEELRFRLREARDRRLLVTSSGTASVATVAAFVRGLGIKGMHVVAPAYFAIEALCSNLGIALSYSSVHRSSDGYHLPPVPDVPPLTAVWLTLPVFGTSCYLEEAEVGSWIDALPSDTIVVVDESLAYIDRKCLGLTASMDRVIRISTPNKTLCINGEKVSFISAPAKFIESLNDWSECVAGGIGASGLQALRFFRDPSFDAAVVQSRRLIGGFKRRFIGVLADVTSCAHDEATDGHFVMAYWPSLSVARLRDKDLLMRMMVDSGAMIIPASRNRHPENCGLAFRVNLLRLDDAGLGALRRLALFFEAIA